MTSSAGAKGRIGLVPLTAGLLLFCIAVFDPRDHAFASGRAVSVALFPHTHSAAMQSISTSEFPGIPPAAAMVVRTPGSGPKLPRKTSFIAV